VEIIVSLEGIRMSAVFCELCNRPSLLLHHHGWCLHLLAWNISWTCVIYLL